MPNKELFEDKEMIREFVTEGHDMLDEAESKLIELEQSVTESGELDEEVLNTVFRMFHTIKGTSGFFELNNLKNVTHEAETLLDLYRKGKLDMDPSHNSLLFKATDFIRKILSNIEEYMSDEGYELEASDIIGTISNIYKSGEESAEEQPKKSEKPKETTKEEKPAEKPEKETTEKCDISQDFIAESTDILEELEQILMDIEKDTKNQDKIGSAFRLLHTFKGNCGIYGLIDLEKLSHKAESFLDLARNNELVLNRDAVGVLLSITDVLQDGLKDVSEGKGCNIMGCDPMIIYLDEVMQTLRVSKEPIGDEIVKEEPPKEDKIIEEPEVAKEPPIVKEDKKTNEDKDKKISELNKEIESTRQKAKPPSAVKKSTSAENQYIRIDLDKVSKLIDWVGELAIAEVMLTENPDIKAIRKKRDFQRAAFNLHRIISEVQNLAMNLRMVQIAATFKKMNRLVHDISRKFNKKVKLTLIGEETEVDKSVVDAIGDPLVHIVRNSVDHGIEPPEEREKVGKNPTGDLVIEAKNEEGEIRILIKDDGRGINKEKVLEKAIERGLVEGDGSHLKDEDIYRFIFEAGFSTAEKVTEVSGRGVGMDVVRRNLEQIKGHIDVMSYPGKGTVITLRIPLTMAIIEGMLVKIGKSRYTIPLLSIKELFRPAESNITTTTDGHEVIRVREDLIPVIRLHELFEITPEYTDLIDGVLITVEYNKTFYCFFVDEIIGQQQAVMKRLPEYVGVVEGLSGCTILGDGNISPIIDIGSVIKLSEKLSNN